MHPAMYLDVIRRALAEDLGEAGDLTTEACIPVEARGRAEVMARAAGVIAGLAVAEAVFSYVEPGLEFKPAITDGTPVAAGTAVAVVEGPTRGILTGERTALNLLGRMSGVATATRRLVEAVEGTGVAIADTRKTMPGLRALDKYAVRMGGGRNHRFGLGDAVMVKDNHISACGGIREAVEAVRARVGHMVAVSVEVETLDELSELLEVGADVVLLDNMDPATLADAVRLVDGAMICEASGGVMLENVRALAGSGVDVISVGWITHSAPQLDIALDL